jgi:hypothetical protein
MSKMRNSKGGASGLTIQRPQTKFPISEKIAPMDEAREQLSRMPEMEEGLSRVSKMPEMEEAQKVSPQITIKHLAQKQSNPHMMGFRLEEKKIGKYTVTKYYDGEGRTVFETLREDRPEMKIDKVHIETGITPENVVD